MQDRIKFVIAVFDRHNCNTPWEFKHFIHDDNNWGVTTCGDVVNVGCYSAHYRRDNAPDSVHRAYEPIHRAY